MSNQPVIETTPKRYYFDKVVEAGIYECKVDTASGYGYFEHTENGNGGGLWFDGLELTDYDGMACLPKAVNVGLKAAGFVVTSDFD